MEATDTESSAERFVAAFGPRVAEPFKGGSRWTLTQVGLVACEDGQVRTEFVFVRLGHRRDTLTLIDNAVVYDPVRDLDLEFDSAASAVGFDLEDPAQLEDALTQFRAAGVIGAEFEYQPTDEHGEDC